MNHDWIPDDGRVKGTEIHGGPTAVKVHGQVFQARSWSVPVRRRLVLLDVCQPRIGWLKIVWYGRQQGLPVLEASCWPPVRTSRLKGWFRFWRREVATDWNLALSIQQGFPELPPGSSAPVSKATPEVDVEQEKFLSL